MTRREYLALSMGGVFAARGASYRDYARASPRVSADVNRRPYYSWQAYVIDAMAIGRDGTVYLGQSERKSRLYLYYPEAGKWRIRTAHAGNS